MGCKNGRIPKSRVEINPVLDQNKTLASVSFGSYMYILRNYCFILQQKRSLGWKH